MNCHRSNCCFFFVSGVLERDRDRAGKEENVKVRRSKASDKYFYSSSSDDCSKEFFDDNFVPSLF